MGTNRLVPNLQIIMSFHIQFLTFCPDTSSPSLKIGKFQNRRNSLTVPGEAGMISSGGEHIENGKHRTPG
jgi:hypothetical protein